MLKYKIISLFIVVCFLSIESNAQGNVEKYIYMIRIPETKHHKAILQTGFRLEGRKGIITALHGVADGKAFSGFNESGDVLSDLRVVNVDIDNDLALLWSKEIDDRISEGLKVPVNLKLISGENLWVLGHPQGINLYIKHVTTGIPVDKKLHMLIPPASAEAFEKRKSPSASIRVLNIQGNLVPGDSGAPIINSKNQVVGIVNGGLLGGAAAICWAIPIDSIKWCDVNSDRKRLRKLANLETKDLFAYTEDTVDNKISYEDEITVLEETLTQYSNDIKKFPGAASIYKNELEKIVHKIQGDREIEKRHPRLVAIAYRLYAASLILQPVDKNTNPNTPLDLGYPWLKRSTEINTNFKDDGELKAAENYIKYILFDLPQSVPMEDLLTHEYRVAMIEASDMEVKKQVEISLGIIINIKKDPVLHELIKNILRGKNNSDNKQLSINRKLQENEISALELGIYFGSKVVLAILPIGQRAKPLSGINYTESEIVLFLSSLGITPADSIKAIASVKKAMKNPNPLTAASILLGEMNKIKEFLNKQHNLRLLSINRIGFVVGYLLENSLVVMSLNPKPEQIRQNAPVDQKFKSSFPTDILIAQLPKELTDNLNKTVKRIETMDDLRTQIEACKNILKIIHQ